MKLTNVITVLLVFLMCTATILYVELNRDTQDKELVNAYTVGRFSELKLMEISLKENNDFRDSVADYFEKLYINSIIIYKDRNRANKAFLKIIHNDRQLPTDKKDARVENRGRFLLPANNSKEKGP